MTMIINCMVKKVAGSSTDTGSDIGKGIMTRILDKDKDKDIDFKVLAIKCSLSYMNYDINCDMGIITYQAYFEVFIKGIFNAIKGQGTRVVMVSPNDSVEDLRDRLYMNLQEQTLGYDTDGLPANYRTTGSCSMRRR